MMGHPSRDRPPVMIAYCGCNRSATSPIFNASSPTLMFDELEICWCCNIMPLPANELILPDWFGRILWLLLLLPDGHWKPFPTIVIPFENWWCVAEPLACGWWRIVCTDAVLATDDWCWNKCWCDLCKLWAIDLVAFSGTNGMSCSSEERKENRKINGSDSLLSKFWKVRVFVWRIVFQRIQFRSYCVWNTWPTLNNASRLHRLCVWEWIDFYISHVLQFFFLLQLTSRDRTNRANVCHLFDLFHVTIAAFLDSIDSNVESRVATEINSAPCWYLCCWPFTHENHISLFRK